MPKPTPPFILIICDGWGVAPAGPGNAITLAHTPNLDRLNAHWPHTTVEASGLAVGLPAGQQGNSEVGHLTIGSGRIIHQPLSRQLHEISSGAFYQNEVLITAIETAKQRGSAVHILGLVSPGGVHSHTDGALALVELAQRLGQKEVYIHAFTDGRDTPPTSSFDHIIELEAELARIGTGRLVSLAGRYYAMDRDNRWDRIELAYDMLTSIDHPSTPVATDHLAASYHQNQTDEFLKPIRINPGTGKQTRIQDNDVVIFFNFRPDRARQLSHALVDESFTEFKRKRVLKNLHFVSFSEYDETLAVNVAFPKQNIANSLGEIVSRAGLGQLHLAETEKYAHVTYFLNGGREEPFAAEDRIMIPSLKVATYDETPTMSAEAVTNAALKSLEQDKYQLIIVNFANADMVGHTGNIPAAITAIETLDDCLGRLIDATLAIGGSALMTADHGNAEIELNPDTGEPFTSHTTSAVPVLLCGIEAKKLRTNGGLQDIAPTILSAMGLPIADSMTGTTLIN